MDKIDKIDYTINNIQSEDGYLELKIKGKNINYIIINTLRRAILSYIPIYAFTEFDFKINTSIYNNCYLKLRYNNLPVLGIKNDLIIYDSEKNIIDENIENIDVFNYVNQDEINYYYESDNDNNNKINSSSLKQLTMYINCVSSEKMQTITTDDAQFYFAEKSIKNPYKIAIPLVELQQNQKITFSAITTIGIEDDDTIFTAVSTCYYKEINENEFIFKLQSTGQLTEHRIIQVGILNILNKLKNILNKLNEEVIETTKGELLILNEDSTIGNLLSYGMNLHKDVKNAGYNTPHLLEKNVKIHYELINENSNLHKIMNDVVEYFNELFNNLLNNLKTNDKTNNKTNDKKKSKK